MIKRIEGRERLGVSIHRLYSSLSFLKVFILTFFFLFCLHWVFVAACRLSLVVASGGYSSLQCVGFSCGGFSCCGAWALGVRASVVAVRGLSGCGSWALGRRLRSCGAQT